MFVFINGWVDMIRPQQYHFVTAGVAGNDFKGGFGSVKGFGQKLEAHPVGGIVHRWCGQFYLKHRIVDSGNLILR